ncbi:hypothetical protein ACQCVP_22375 [Rossellomorea vietnamensis]
MLSEELTDSIESTKSKIDVVRSISRQHRSSKNEIDADRISGSRQS